MAVRDIWSWGLDELSESRVRRVDQLCDGFEMAWRTGRSPRIEDFLQGAAEGSPERAVLLRELVALDVAYRLRAGESPEAGDYRTQFPDLRESWIAADLKPAAAAVAATAPEAELAPSSGVALTSRRLGKFLLHERVGGGGSGTVWRALDVSLNRVVALKIPHVHLTEDEQVVERFWREARAVAQLRHPGIVPVHEVLVLDGLPILVCEYVTGTTLRALLERGRLSHRAAARLVAEVADALAYAHSMGAVHRDIKAANIMVNQAFTRPDDVGEADWPGTPRIVDFGLAYLERESVRLTHEGAVVGTPAYMSPEQAVGTDPLHPIGHQTDIYSLGVVLYEMLCGQLPFSGSRRDVLARIVNSEPTPPRKRDRSIPRDLESICQKAMARDPRDRYATARAMAEDLRHYLDGESVQARPLGLWRRILRRSQHRPAEAALILMGVVTTMAVWGLVVGHLYNLRLERQYQVTEAARRGEAQSRELAVRLLYYQRIARAEQEWMANNVDRTENLLDECPAHLRGWEWRYLKSQCRYELLTLSHAQPGKPSWTVTGVRYVGDGRRIASITKGGLLHLWDAQTGAHIGQMGNSCRALYALASCPGTDLLATGGEDGVIRLWDARKGQLIRSIATGPETIYALAFRPDGSELASGHGYPALHELEHLRGKGIIRIWDASTGELKRALRGHGQNIMGLAYSPDGTTMASAGGSMLAVPQAVGKPGELILWDTATGWPIRSIHGHTGPVTALAYDPTGELIATASWDSTVRLWEAATGAARRTLAGHQDWALAVSFSPDGERIATAGADGVIKIWERQGDREPCTLRGHGQNVASVAFSPDGRRLASASSDQTVKVWNATTSREATRWAGAGGPIVRIAFFPDGALLVAANREDAEGRVCPRLVILNAKDGLTARLCIKDHHGPGSCDVWPLDGMAIAHDGRRVATASGIRVEILNASDWSSTFRRDEPTSRFQAVGFSPDGRTLVAGGQAHAYYPDGRAVPNFTYDNALLVAFDAESGRERWREAGDETGMVRDLAFSPDGRLLATADTVGTVTLRRAETGAVVARLRGHRRLASHVAFSPNGHRLASTSWDATVALWDVAIGRPVARLQGHMRSVICAAFSPDGHRLATSSEDRTVRLWDVRSGQELMTLHGHADIVTSVAFSPDGNRLASAGADGTVLIREAARQ